MKRLTDWLKKKATSAQSSAKEVAEFTTWLVVRPSAEPKPRTTPNSYASGKGSTKVTAGEVTEFMGWLHRGMTSANFNDNERRQMKEWVTGRMDKDPGFTNPDD